MSLPQKAEHYLQSVIASAMQRLRWPKIDIAIERPRQESFGDFATPTAMTLAHDLRKAPRVIAQELLAALQYDSTMISEISIDGPGFINFRLGPGYWQSQLSNILQQKEDFGKSTWGTGRKLQVEFVSANPTGPLNVVSARAASVGDVLVSLFQTVGFIAAREYYVNDAGRQIRLLGESVSARYMELCGKDEKFPEEGYHGEYIGDLAKEIHEQYNDRFVSRSKDERTNQLGDLALERMVKLHQDTLSRFRVNYDLWFRERSLRASNRQQEVLDILKQKNLSFEQEGALWFRSSQFGDEKDRVLMTSAGEPTYFLTDIAYHLDKYRRGFEMLYDLWGPDHHGYIPRMKAALVALGFPAESFEVRIIQQVNLLRNGELVKMSKRAGNIIEMAEVLDEVGVDAARFFFLMRKLDSPLDFDLDLAKKQTDENPVYYVQYAHARICSILNYAQAQVGNLASGEKGKYDLSKLTAAEEISLIKKLAEFPEVISKAAQFLEPNRLTTYLIELAATFHKFYHEHRVVSDDQALTSARLRLVEATKIVLANALRLLNISAPEKM
jgi:arginyl-tRNA synthetase